MFFMELQWIQLISFILQKIYQMKFYAFASMFLVITLILSHLCLCPFSRKKILSPFWLFLDECDEGNQKIQYNLAIFGS